MNSFIMASSSWCARTVQWGPVYLRHHSLRRLWCGKVNGNIASAISPCPQLTQLNLRNPTQRHLSSCSEEESSESTESKLFKDMAPAPENAKDKITVVGVGQVGMACAVSVLLQEITSHLCLIDMAEDKLNGEMMDLQHGTPFIKNAKVEASTDYALSAGSKLCIITAGARQEEGESRLNLVQRNVDVMKTIVKPLVKYSPDTILVMVSNPVDILAFVSWKLTGLPKHRILGPGTSLDTARFRYLISQKLGIAPTSVHGYIIGEHGDSSVAVWSEVNVAGRRLIDINPCIGTKDDPECWDEIHKAVIASAYEIIKYKGYTCWAIGVVVADICRAICRNSKQIVVASTHVQGVHGIEEDVYLSLPCVLSEDGVSQIAVQNLSDSEKKMLHKSAKLMKEVQDGLKM